MSEPNPDALFAVVDVETTGFSPLVGDRIVEIAIVRIAADGSVVDEYATLVNPLRDVGQSHIHGITQDDVAQAPIFAEVVGDILERLDSVIFAAHNVRFDHDFLASELSSEGVFLPAIPRLCTLKLGYRLHPELMNHRLATCCEAAGLDHLRPHTALEDARTTARLLSAYVAEAQGAGISSLRALGLHPELFPHPWPTWPSSGRVAIRKPGERPDVELPYMARLVAGLATQAADEAVAPYVDLLGRALEDRQITEAESQALQATAQAWGLSQEQVVAANNTYLKALVAGALADGVVTYTERRDLEAVTHLLALDPALIDAMLYELARDRD